VLAFRELVWFLFACGLLGCLFVVCWFICLWIVGLLIYLFVDCWFVDLPVCGLAAGWCIITSSATLL
jgi:hypothetical protein